LGYRKRTDHTITNLTNIVRYREKLEIVILDDHSKVFLLSKNSKNGIQQTPISLIQSNGHVTESIQKIFLCFTRWV
jgi:thiamine pyrophosphokinase